MPTDLPALAARLREGTGPNYQLGLDVIAAFVDGDPMLWMGTRGDPTASIDSIVALVRKLKPRALIDLHTGPEGTRASIWGSDVTYRNVSAPTPALALCLALVEWRIARGG